VAVGEWGRRGCEEREREFEPVSVCFHGSGHCHDYVVGFWFVYGDAEGNNYGGYHHDYWICDCYGIHRDRDEYSERSGG
jgi:hypothetical protein